MPELMITCPNKGKEIATGVEINPNEPRKAARLFVRCPHCGILHSCSPGDGIVKDAQPQDDATTSQWVVEA